MDRITKRISAHLKTSAALLVAGFVAFPAFAANEQTVDAFAAWEGQGVTYQTGVNRGTFVGTLGGPLLIQSEKGPLAAGRIVCPALVEIDLVTAKQVGVGKCTITADDGARVFATWVCEGVHFLGCDGILTLTGGTERMAGVTGSGEIKVRSTSRLLAETTDGSLMQFGGGILELKQVTYAVPSE